VRRLLVPWSGLVVAVLAVLTLVGATLPAEAKAKRSATSFVYVESDPGSVTGDGLTYLAAQPSATIRVEGSKRAPDMVITADQGGDSFTFTIDRDLPDRITAGVHEFDPLEPGGYGFLVTLPRSLGATLQGTLDIRQLEFSKDGLQVARLDLTFTAYSSSFGSGRLRGHLAYRSTKSLELPSTRGVLQGGEWVQGRRSLLNAQGLDSGEGRGEIAQRLSMGGDGQAVLVRRDWPDFLYPENHVDKVAWTSPTAGSDADRLYLSTSGRFSVRAGADDTVWSVRPKGAGKGTFLLVNYDGRLLLVSARLKVLWSVG